MRPRLRGWLTLAMRLIIGKAAILRSAPLPTCPNGVMWIWTSGAVRSGKVRAKATTCAVGAEAGPPPASQRRKAAPRPRVEALWFKVGVLTRTPSQTPTCSIRFSPTSGEAATISMPSPRRVAGSPIPESMSSCGELIAPPERMTPRRAFRVRIAPSCSNATPTARPPSNRTR